MTIWNQTQGFSLGPNPSSLHARNRQYLCVRLVFDQLSYPFVYIKNNMDPGWTPENGANIIINAAQLPCACTGIHAAKCLLIPKAIVISMSFL